MKRTLRTLLTTTVLTAICVANAQADWKTVAEGMQSETTVYQDASTRQRTGNKVRIWQMSDHLNSQTSSSTGKHYSSTKELVVYDCKERKSQLLTLVGYAGRMGQGEVIFSESEVGPESYTVPGSIGEFTLKAACGR